MSLVGPLTAGVVVLPAVGALAVFLTGDRSERRYWRITTLTLSLTTLLAIALAVLLDLGGPTVYRPLEAPIGITFSLDVLSVTVGLLDVVLKLGILCYTRTAGPHDGAFHVSFLLFTTGVFGVVFSGDLVLTGGFLLVLIVATTRLIACSDKPGSRDTARGYRRTASLGVTAYVVGVVLAAWLGGTTDHERLAAELATTGYAEPATIVAFVFMTIGLGLLAALIPLHGWLIEAHAKADDPVSALVSGVLPAAAVYALVRVLYDVFTVEFLAANPTIASGMINGALVSLLLGSLLAFGQRNIKGVLAYSTVSQFGLVFAGLLVANETAIFGSVIQLFGHGIVKGAFCIVAGIIAIRFDARTIDEYDGLADRAPVVSVVFAGLGIALIGLPPTVGFVGKWYIAVGAFADGFWLVALFVIVSTVLTIGYVVPFLSRIYFGSFEGTDHGRAVVTTLMIAAIVIAVVLSVAVGLASVFLESLFREAIEQLVS
ncbi:monovalent cation/H+ antiporter subunit D family protein [Natronorubrum sp. JWXQ-INN-674]|uniref:Monovalent cation/H+ antiporter subunit D family protein n=1 Tax=Natronorubrum halalkaliphilum TaxID=2691917 RepID=A0A6B0VLB7_9EURY|nr:proton-conducting transporter membrane subunit [Natronorubrum halalkaliphilum]MXV61917.1 monovalent cation/H+ antiporter subunit D family protein [Natronorubrum halalkaliphilum]